MPDDENSTDEPTSGEGVDAPLRTIDVASPLFASLVEAAAWGEASDDDLAVLEGHKGAWQRELVERLVAFLQERGAPEPEDFEVLREDVRFMLPKEIRKGLAAAADH